MKKMCKRVLAAMMAAVLFVCMFVPAFGSAEQNLITKKTPLLKEDGSLTEPGYCFTDLYEYDRDAIKAPGWRIKEWDFYQISNERYTIQVTIADISLGGAVTVGGFDRQTGENFSTMTLSLFTGGKYKLGLENEEGLTNNDWVPHTYKKTGRNFDFELSVNATERKLKFHGKAGGDPFDVDLTMYMLPNHESHFTALPFDGKPDHFYYNQKTNCMATVGTVKIGDKEIEFKGKPDNAYAVLDWGRGVWPFHETWWWGNGSWTFYDENQQEHIFGFEIGWDFCNTSAASESTAFLDGKAYKLGYLKFENQEEVVKPWDSDWADNNQIWKITSDDGSFEMEMTPEYDNYTMLRFIFVGNLCHQVFGKWNGTVKCGDQVIEVKDMTAFLERSDNMW